jgi:hypothetical protein
MREMRADGQNDQEKLGLKIVSCPSQFTIPHMAGMSPNLAGNSTNSRCSRSNQASVTPDFSYPHISSISLSSSSPISLYLVHNSTIIAEYNVVSSVSISACHHHELTLVFSIAPRSAYTKCSIHRAQNTPSAAYTDYRTPLRLSVFP